MFLPNGEGSLEWRLSFDVELPEGCSLLVQDAGQKGFRVVMGVLPGPVMSRMNAASGFSLALRPERQTRVKRGDPIAQLIAISRDTLRMNLDSQRLRLPLQHPL